MSVPFKEWDYKWFPSDEEREARCIQLVADIRDDQSKVISLCADTRSVHAYMFNGMTDPGDEYFAGNYRGEPYLFLKHYEIEGEIGVPASLVSEYMQRFAPHVEDFPSKRDRITKNQLPKQALITTVGLVCDLMVDFFTIHPYANGNGHIGRYITWALLAKSGYRPKHWEVNRNFGSRQEYGRTIMLYRHGHKAPLIRFVLSSI